MTFRLYELATIYLRTVETYSIVGYGAETLLKEFWRESRTALRVRDCLPSSSLIVNFSRHLQNKNFFLADKRVSCLTSRIIREKVPSFRNILSLLVIKPQIICWCRLVSDNLYPDNTDTQTRNNVLNWKAWKLWKGLIFRLEGTFSIYNF